MKKITTILLFLLIVQVSFAQNMSIGLLKLVTPSRSISVEVRVITSSSEIGTYDSYINVGGIIFEQTAEPSNSLNINSISIDYDNGTIVTINGIDYMMDDIPVWQLQPIVEYANDTNHDVLTIYGKGESQILMHKAFVDKLIGLRLLQVDLMLAGNFLDLDDAWQIPKIRKKYVYASSETDLVPFDDKSVKWIDDKVSEIENVILSDSSDWASYTFTDHNSEVVFNTIDDKIVIETIPYYLFQIDKINIKKLDSAMSDFAQEDLSGVFGEDFSFDLYLMNQYMNNNYMFMNEVTSYISNSEEETNKDILLELQSSFCDSNIIHINQLAAYIDALYSEDIDLYSDLKDIKDEYFEEDASYLYLYKIVAFNYQPYGVITDCHTTNTLKRNWELIYNYNPIVYDVAVNTAQFSSFFRYIKQENPTSWKRYMHKVSRLEYNAPKVTTPIGFERKKK